MERFKIKMNKYLKTYQHGEIISPSMEIEI